MNCFKVARSLGKTVQELLETITYSELIEWFIFFELDPPIENRTEISSAIVASTIANINRQKNSKVYGLEDFIPKYQSEKKEFKSVSWQENLKKIELLNELFHGKDERSENL